jgi:hypothetical protein
LFAAGFEYDASGYTTSKHAALDVKQLGEVETLILKFRDVKEEKKRSRTPKRGSSADKEKEEISGEEDLVDPEDFAGLVNTGGGNQANVQPYKKKEEKGSTLLIL